jgi:uncharacterized protein YecT (DUF1311 family)
MGALEFDNARHSVGEMRRLIAQAQAGGQVARAKHLESELNWRMRRMAARPAEAATYARAADAGAADAGAADWGADPVRPRPSPTAAARSGSPRTGSGRVWQLAAAALAGAAAASVAGWWLTSAGFAPRPTPASAPAGQAPSTPAAIPISPAALAPSPSPTAHASPAQRRPAACRAPATPGQQAVCASRGLLAQDRRMLRAYQHAVAAGANRLTLDRGQAQWRELRDRTSSPARLAQLYRARTAALDAAARRAPAHARAHATPRHARHHRWW